MNRRDFLRASAPLVLAPNILARRGFAQTAEPTPAPLPPPGAGGWVSLLNGRDLTGWYSMLQRSGTGVAEQKGLIMMEEEMLHIMGNEEGSFPAEGGYLATHQEFSNVQIRVEYKWGVKRHAPRNTTKRDNGVLYGLVGPDRVWPTCVECQIEEGDVGDFFMLGGTRAVQSNHSAGLFGQGLESRDGMAQARRSGLPRRWPRSRGRGEAGWPRSCRSTPCRTHRRQVHQGRQLRTARSVEHRRGDLAGRPGRASRQRPHRQRGDRSPTARSPEPGPIHSAHPGQDRDRDRVRGDLGFGGSRSAPCRAEVRHRIVLPVSV